MSGDIMATNTGNIGQHKVSGSIGNKSTEWKYSVKKSDMQNKGWRFAVQNQSNGNKQK